MDDSIWPSTSPARSKVTGSVSPMYPMIARRLRYDSAGFSPQAVCADTIVIHPPSRSTQRRPGALLKQHSTAVSRRARYLLTYSGHRRLPAAHGPPICAEQRPGPADTWLVQISELVLHVHADIRRPPG